MYLHAYPQTVVTLHPTPTQGSTSVTTSCLYPKPSLPPFPPPPPPHPQEAWLSWRFPNHSPAVFLDVVWLNKTSTRLPEAGWLRFRPGPQADPDSWRMHKLGSLVNPSDVLLNGSMSLHAVTDEGVQVGEGGVRWAGMRGMRGGGMVVVGTGS